MNSVISGAALDENLSSTATQYVYPSMAAGTGGFSWSATESNRIAVVPHAFTLDHFYITLKTAPGGTASYTFTVRKNGVDTALTATVSGTSIYGADFSHTVTFAAGDTFSLKCVPTGSPAVGYSQWSFRQAATNANAIFFRGSNPPTTTGGTDYMSLGQMNDGISTSIARTDANVATIIPAGGTFKNFYVVLENSMGTGNTVTYTVYKNGIATSLSFTVTGPATTGSDTTHSVSVIPGDTISIQEVVTGTSIATSRHSHALTFNPSTDGDYFLTGSYETTYDFAANTITQYRMINGDNQVDEWDANASTDETLHQTVTYTAFVRALYVSIGTAPGVGTSRTIYLRVNGVNSAIAVTISGTNTSASIINQAVGVVYTDLLSLANVPTNTPASDSGVFSTSILFNETLISGKTQTGKARIIHHQYASVGFQGDSNLIAYAKASLLSNQQQLKTFQYKVFDNQGNYLGNWNDVTSDFSINQQINTSGSALTVTLGRSIDTPLPDIITLDTEASEDFNTEAGETLLSDNKSPNRVGPGTDVAVDNKVEVWVYYGTSEDLTDDTGVDIVTDTIDQIMLDVGAPNGTRIFQGSIEYYEANYGTNDSVTVLINPFGMQLDNYVNKNGETTTITYSYVDPAFMLKDTLTNIIGQGSVINFTSYSIINTNLIASYEFRLNTALEVLKQTVSFAPYNWFWWFDCAENIVYLQPQPSVPAHTFILGQHIIDMTFKETKENMINSAYFQGGDTGGGVYLYRKYSDATSIAAHGQRLNRATDQRVIVYDSADVIENALIAENKNTIFAGTVTISSIVFDIESIKLGQLVAFANFGNIIDGTSFLVAGIYYQPDSVKLTLQQLPPIESQRLEEINRDLITQQQLTTPSTPS